MCIKKYEGAGIPQLKACCQYPPFLLCPLSAVRVEARTTSLGTEPRSHGSRFLLGQHVQQDDRYCHAHLPLVNIPWWHPNPFSCQCMPCIVFCQKTVSDFGSRVCEDGDDTVRRMRTASHSPQHHCSRPQTSLLQASLMVHHHCLWSGSCACMCLHTWISWMVSMWYSWSPIVLWMDAQQAPSCACSFKLWCPSMNLPCSLFCWGCKCVSQ